MKRAGYSLDQSNGLAFHASGRSGGIRPKEVTMPIVLSPDAVAMLRFEIKGYRSKVPGRRLTAYRELVAARIMIPLHSFVGGREAAYRFTYWG